MSLGLQILSKRKFYGYRNLFYRQVEANHLHADLTQVVVSSGNDFDAFMGDSSRSNLTKRIKCLFDLQAVGRSRTEFGIREDTEVVLYLSPVSLSKIFGFTKFPDPNKIKVNYQGEDYLISFVRYLEEMYGDCIAIQLELKTDRRGG